MKRQMTFQKPALEANKSHRVPRAREVNVATDRDVVQQIDPSDDGTATRSGMVLQPLDPPCSVKARLCNPPLIFGFDIETHGWPSDIDDQRKGHIGAFGWYSLAPPALLKYARIVELAWVMGPVASGAPVTKKSARVKPDGFCISSEAFKFHGISNEEAHRGSDLADVLQEFMEDVISVSVKGARLCAHHLEFDAGIISEELTRCGMEELQKHWMGIATNKGYCTMNPDAGRWIWQCLGRDVGPTTTQHVKGLSTLLELLVPERPELRQEKNRHKAIVDAEGTCLIYAALLRHAGLSPAQNRDTEEMKSVETDCADALDGKPDDIASDCG